MFWDRGLTRQSCPSIHDLIFWINGAVIFKIIAELTMLARGSLLAIWRWVFHFECLMHWASLRAESSLRASATSHLNFLGLILFLLHILDHVSDLGGSLALQIIVSSVCLLKVSIHFIQSGSQSIDVVLSIVDTTLERSWLLVRCSWPRHNVLKSSSLLFVYWEQSSILVIIDGSTHHCDTSLKLFDFFLFTHDGSIHLKMLLGWGDDVIIRYVEIVNNLPHITIRLLAGAWNALFLTR